MRGILTALPDQISSEQEKSDDHGDEDRLAILLRRLGILVLAHGIVDLPQQDLVLRSLVAGALVFGSERTIGSQSQAICFSFRAYVKPANRPRVFTLRGGQFNLETGCVPTGERGVKARSRQ